VAESVAGVEGLSIVVAAPSLTFKRGQQLDTLFGDAVPVRADCSSECKALNSFVVADSGTMGGKEKLLFGFLSLVAHSCQPSFRLQKLEAKSSAKSTAAAADRFVLKATRKVTLTKGSLVAFAYAAPDKLWFECRCEHVGKHPKLEEKAAVRKRKLNTELRDERQSKRLRVRGSNNDSTDASQVRHSAQHA
jgi:hypothetical protein